MTDTASLLSFYRRHVERVLLPFWDRALDHQNGGIYTCFTNSGDRLISRDKYTWSQGRYLWLWSKIAAMTAEGRLNGKTAAIEEHLKKTVLFLEHNVFLDNGNCVFLLSETGEKKEPIPGKGYDTSIYADCFVSLGFAGFAGLTKDVRWFDHALRLYKKTVERVSADNYRTEPYPVPNGYRAHSIPMILLNVSQELAGVAELVVHPEGESIHRESISYMRDIMENFCQSDHSIAELISRDSSKKNTLLRRHRNPGHAIESMWFVMHTAHNIGQTDYIYKAGQAVEKAIESGWDIDFGGLFRFVDRKGGKPKGEKHESFFEKMITDTWDMKLWWPHSEALYATLVGYKLTGNRRMLELHDKIKNYVFDTFPNPDKETGEWIQIRDREGKPLDKVVALPVKDPFHVLRSLLLIMNLLEKLQTENKRDSYG